MINSVGGSPMMMPGMTQRMPGAHQRQTPVGETGASDRAGNDMAQRASTARSSEPAARASTEAKGMFVDIYA